jgi:hypothetical protein
VQVGSGEGRARRQEDRHREQQPDPRRRDVRRAAEERTGALGHVELVQQVGVAAKDALGPQLLRPAIQYGGDHVTQCATRVGHQAVEARRIGEVVDDKVADRRLDQPVVAANHVRS